MTAHSKHVPLQGALNFRDFGGYPTQSGRRIIDGYFYRSDKLSELTEHDHTTLTPHKIGRIFDLRRPDEVTRAPTQWFSSPVEIHHYSLIHPSLDGKGLLAQFNHLLDHPQPGVALMENLYRDMAKGEHSFQYFQQLFQQLLEQSDSPILVHCSGGKDRTGTTCALIQWVLGCDMNTIMHDYMLSKTFYCDNVDPRHMAMQLAQLDANHAVKDEWMIPIMQVQESYLEAMFEALLDRFPEPEDFLTDGLGLADDSLLILRQLYTETE